MSSERLLHVVNTVQEWVDNDEIVGAIVLVIRHDKVVLHEAVGWSDREKNIPMEVGTILQMRSMTKPLTGTAVLMLMEEGRLLLDDKVSQYLPSFDNPRSKNITVYQLLTHTSGLPGDLRVSSLFSQRQQYASLRENVDHLGRMGPLLEPGTDFQYSDHGSRVLGALIEEISGIPADEFIQRRILDPLQMKDSFFSHTRPDNQRRSRIATAYRSRVMGARIAENRGSTPKGFSPEEPGNWDIRFDNSEFPIAQYFRPSSGLLSTAMDYANFMSMMLSGGRFGTRQLLSPATVKLATSPHSEYVYDAASLRETWRFYGLQWRVLTDKYRLIPGQASSGSFGHNGVLGTEAWADPQEDLIFMYLTQSQGHQTRGRFDQLVYAAVVE